ncbi:hypothetical protein JOF56_011379 [Kibdelosporangium banguiense]|uniref:Uncharacterized protein n=1 Tax=Kibdelosporangium banguiense TaxID=1365924 RepID=A0ABS4U2U5_9PSEU|nr:hypothetical protein [Kibdelosporangium banguiense]MBP2330994.1 hypothetical protein [Kibdelosporangium banguiense]
MSLSAQGGQGYPCCSANSREPPTILPIRRGSFDRVVADSPANRLNPAGTATKPPDITLVRLVLFDQRSYDAFAAQV